MGIRCAGWVFQKTMMSILGGLIGRCCLIYIDDLVVFSETFEEHTNALREIFERLKYADLKLHMMKSKLLARNFTYLGFEFRHDGTVRMDQKKIDAILKIPPPKTVKQVRGFLGAVLFQRRYIKDHAKIARPLYELTKKEVPLIWSEECQIAFDTLKLALSTPPVLHLPTPKLQYVLYTDASDVALGWSLHQLKAPKQPLHTVGYGGRELNNCERKYSTFAKELLGLRFAIKSNEMYLHGGQTF